LLTVRGEEAIIWEVKSINTSENINERDQIRSAIAQLIEYEFILSEEDQTIQKFYKAVVLSKKPVSLQQEKFHKYLDLLERNYGFIFSGWKTDRLMEQILQWLNYRVS